MATAQTAKKTPAQTAKKMKHARAQTAKPKIMPPSCLRGGGVFISLLFGRAGEGARFFGLLFGRGAGSRGWACLVFAVWTGRGRGTFF